MTADVPARAAARPSRLFCAFPLALLLAFAPPGASRAFAQATQTIALAPGFVFACPTVAPASPLTSRALIEGTAAIENVFVFDEDAKAFRYQLRLPGGDLFGSDLALAPGAGFILRCTAAGSLAFTGTPLQTGSAALPAGFSFRGFGRLVSAPTARGLLSAHGALRSVFRWNAGAGVFDFVLRLGDGTLFGNDFPLASGGAYFFDSTAGGTVTFGVPFVTDVAAYFRELQAVEPLPVAVTLLFFSDEACRVTAQAAPAGSSSFGAGVSDASPTRTHALQITGLSALHEYDVRFLVEAADGRTFAAEPGPASTPLRVRTSAPAQVTLPMSVAGRVVDGTGTPLGGVAAVLRVAGESSPLYALTSVPSTPGTGGIFFLDLSNLKNAATGELLSVTPGLTQLTIDLYAPGKRNAGNLYLLGAGDGNGESPFEIPTPYVLE